MSVHFSSKTDEWETPQELFDRLDCIHQFEVDVCATEMNTKCGFWFDKQNDALLKDWSGWSSLWMNPPYGRKIGSWIKKAYEESQKGCKVVCLIPARTDTKWWHEYVMKGKIEFLRGRLKFGKSKNSAPFPSAIVIFDLYS